MDKMCSNFFLNALNMILNSFPGVIDSLIPFFTIFNPIVGGVGIKNINFLTGLIQAYV